LAIYIAIERDIMKTTVDRFGRIVIPKEVRDRHGLLPGSELEIEDSADSIVLRVLADLPGLLEKEGVLVFRGRAAGDLDSAIRNHRNERLRRAGGSPA
jgi:AbrB family looped-hinge helix DNA binding protein